MVRSYYIGVALIALIGLGLSALMLPRDSEIALIQFKDKYFTDALSSYEKRLADGDWSLEVVKPLSDLYLQYGEIKKAIRLMERHIEQPLTIGAIAKRTGLSARSLEKIFARAVGEGPGRYYLRLRLKVARRLITDTKSPLADIAARTGFSSASAFTRTFRNFEGKPPSAFRPVH